MALIRSLAALILVIAIAGLAVLNRQSAAFSWSPVHEPYTLPLYFIILAALAIGFLIGGTTVWFNDFHLRTTKRRQNKHIKSLEKELSALKATAANTDTPVKTALPALTGHKANR
ncbi:MAG: LapA family protein [Bdellovibrionales bacterium]